MSTIRAEYGAPGTSGPRGAFSYQDLPAQSGPAPRSGGLSLILWTTTDCNLRCRYCYASGGDKPEYMGWEVAKRALDLAAVGHLGKVQFAGGEPLLNLGLIEEVVAYTRGWNVSYQIQTNGTLLDAATAQLLRRMRIAVGVSLDGVPEVNDRLRPLAEGRGSTAAVIAGIQQAGSAGIRVGMTTVLSHENVEGLPDLVALASYLGNVEGISLDVLRPVGRALLSGVRPPDPDRAAHSVSRAIDRAEEIATMRGNAVKFREVERMRRLVVSEGARSHRCCFDAGQSLMVKPDGNAYPCASLSDFPEFFLGNVMDVHSGGEILQNMARVSGLCILADDCRLCPERSVCGGPCPAQVWTAPGVGQVNRSECAVRTTFIHYAKSKGSYAHATRTSGVSV
jgi:uncharacterized protein